MERHIYRFALMKPRCVSVDQTTVRPDCDAAKEAIGEVGKFDSGRGDRIMVHTGTSTLTFILSESLFPKEVNSLTRALNRDVIAAMNAEVPAERGDMNMYDLVEQD